MSVAFEPPRLLEEVADFLASQPARHELLDYQPSAAATERARDLLNRSSSGLLTADEEDELHQFEQAELLIRLIKARLRQSDHG
uniref:Uncharacterized protein n=1 Tax=Schlesneria paludicola TaxID=360056 RepID=A0A7C2NVU0_9PLAN